MPCNTPGKKIRSKGLGQGLARGNGDGPRGVPLYKKKAKGRGVEEYADVIEYEEW